MTGIETEQRNSGFLEDIIRELAAENAALKAQAALDTRMLDWLEFKMECFCNPAKHADRWEWKNAPETNRNLREAISSAMQKEQAP